MFIKWKYNDHGHADFQELEIPDDFDGYDSVEEYLCEVTDLIPTWSERFMVGRIKWMEITKTTEELQEIARKEIEALKLQIKFNEDRIKELSKTLLNYN